MQYRYIKGPPSGWCDIQRKKWFFSPWVSIGENYSNEFHAWKRVMELNLHGER